MSRPVGTPPLPPHFTAFTAFTAFTLPVQRHLQQPIVGRRTPPYCDYSYIRFRGDHGGPDELWAWCYIATRTCVTSLRAQRFVPTGLDPFRPTPHPWRVVTRYAEGASPTDAQVNYNT